MGDKEVENPATSLDGRARGLDGREKVQTRAAAQQGKKIFFCWKNVRKASESCSRGASYSAPWSMHVPRACSTGDRRPPGCGLRDVRRLYAGMLQSSRLYMFADYILYSVKDTMYK